MRLTRTHPQSDSLAGLGLEPPGSERQNRQRPILPGRLKHEMDERLAAQRFDQVDVGDQIAIAGGHEQ